MSAQPMSTTAELLGEAGLSCGPDETAELDALRRWAAATGAGFDAQLDDVAAVRLRPLERPVPTTAAT